MIGCPSLYSSFSVITSSFVPDLDGSLLGKCFSTVFGFSSLSSAFEM